MPALRLQVKHVLGREMDVSIDFDHRNTFSHGPTLCDPKFARYRRARALLEIITPTAHLWRRVGIIGTCVTYLKIITDAIRDLPATSLMHLSFRCHAYSQAEFLHPLFCTSPTLFSGSAPRLQGLRIVSAALPWGGKAMFRTLTSLEITNVPELRWPTSACLIATLTAATSLASVMFKNYGVRDPASSPLQPYILPALHTLRLVKSSGTDSILTALSFASTPFLNRLLLHEFISADYDTLQRHLKNLSNIQRLVLHGNSSELYAADIQRLFRALPKLHHLDVSLHGEAFIRTLSGDPGLAPLLQELIVGDTDLSTLHGYVMKRTNYRDVKLALHYHVEARDIPEFTNEEVLILMTEMRGRLDGFETSPPTYPVFPPDI